MINSCQTKADCYPCYESPLANLSSEDPDQIYRYRSVFTEELDPPLGPWSSNGCVSVCESNVSQADADLCAENQAKQCANEGLEDPEDPDDDPPTRCWNSAQTASVDCQDGLQFEYTIQAGSVLASNCTEANLAAYSLAQQRALQNRICLSDLPAGICLGVAQDLDIVASGGEAPIIFTLESGALPTGLDWSFSAATISITGTPTAAGDFTFTFRATDVSGRYMEKTYAMAVATISTATPLADAPIGDFYSEVLAQTGLLVPLAWDITSGALPAGLLLDPVSGAVAGTPEEGSEGNYTFTVRATDANDTACSKSFSLEVTNPCQESEYDQSDGDGYSMCVSDGDEAWVVDATAGEIIHFDTDLLPLTATPLGFTPFSIRIAYSPVNECIYIGATNAVYPFDTGVLATGAAIAITGNPLSMLYVPEKDCVYVVSSGGGHRWLYSIDCTTNVATLLSNETVLINLFCYAMFFYDDGAAGKLYGGYVFGAVMGLWYWDFNTGTLNRVMGMVGTAVYGACFDPVGGNAYLELSGAIGVFHVASETLVSTTAYADMNNPGYFVADETLNRPYFIDTNNKLMMYDPVADTFSQVVTDGFAYYHLTMIGQCLFAIGQDGAAPNHYFLKRFNPADFP